MKVVLVTNKSYQDYLLEGALQAAKIPYTVDIQEENRGMPLPHLLVDGIPLDMIRAMKWVQTRKTDGGLIMGNVILYTTGCPKCKVLKAKLDAKNIQYEVCDSIDEMMRLGMSSAPMLRIDGKLYSFTEAISIINTKM